LLWSRHVSNWDWKANQTIRATVRSFSRNMLILGDQAAPAAVWNGSQLTGEGARVMAVNAATGNLIWVTRLIRFPAMIHSSRLFMMASSMSHRPDSRRPTPRPATIRVAWHAAAWVALDVSTGKKLWQTYTVPDVDVLCAGDRITPGDPIPRRQSVYLARIGCQSFFPFTRDRRMPRATHTDSCRSAVASSNWRCRHRRRHHEQPASW